VISVRVQMGTLKEEYFNEVVPIESVSHGLCRYYEKESCCSFAKASGEMGGMESAFRNGQMMEDGGLPA